MSSGYSGTPLAKKLSLKPGMTIWLMDMPDTVRAEIGDAGLREQLAGGGGVEFRIGRLFGFPFGQFGFVLGAGLGVSTHRGLEAVDDGFEFWIGGQRRDRSPGFGGRSAPVGADQPDRDILGGAELLAESGAALFHSGLGSAVRSSTRTTPSTISSI